MAKSKLIIWCEKATSLIRFGPDKMAVYQELHSHLEDSRDSLMEQGLDEDAATERALEVMGDASKIAPQLAAIHQPFWGYFLRISTILLVILLILGTLPIWNYFKDLRLEDRPDRKEFDIYGSTSYGGDTGRTLHHLSEIDESFTSDGSTFTVTNAAVYSEYSEYYERDRTYLYVLIRQSSLLPWTEHEDYSRFNLDIIGWFCARDSLGNVYDGFHGQANTSAGYMYADGVQSGLFTYTHECWINDFPTDAQWVELYYERDGRSYALRINLTGGAGK